MQTFIDTATQDPYSFDDDVIVKDQGGVYTFTTADGQSLNVPTTLQPYTPPAPTPQQIAAEQWVVYKSKALAMLTRSDTTMSRIMEAVILGHNSYTNTDVVTYVNWRRALRSIVSAASGDPTQPLPPEPPFPVGT